MDQPGGPTWDVVENRSCPEIQNHLKTFQHFAVDTSRPFNGTLIRIPLRTDEQAAKSKISDRSVSTEQILDALHSLGHEIRQGGSLFLKHVRQITVRLDSSPIWKVRIDGHDAVSSRMYNDLTLRFYELYAQRSSDRPREAVSADFQVNVHYSEGNEPPVRSSYVLHHLMMSSTGDQHLDRWGRSKKLFPWVAIGAPLTDSEAFKGYLFSILKLPIESSQPVHIHGLFSIAPDRGRLSSSEQTLGSKDMETLWNNFMFSKCVAEAWANLLASRRESSWQKERFAFWPRVENSPTQIWTKLDGFVVDQVISRQLPVWNSFDKCVDLDQGCFAVAHESLSTYVPSFEHIGLPLVTLNASMLELVKNRVASCAKSLRSLSPHSLRAFLRAKKALQVATNLSPPILQYCLLDAIEDRLDENSAVFFDKELLNLLLWPSIEGPLVAYTGSKLFLPRDCDEQALFANSRASSTLNIEGFTSQVRRYLEYIPGALMSVLKFREIADLPEDWPRLYRIPNLPRKDSALRERLSGTESDAIVQKTWDWMCLRLDKDEKLPTSISKLWLIPIKSRRIRRISCQTRDCLSLLLAPQDALYGVIQNMRDGESDANVNILDTDLLPPRAVDILKVNAWSNRELAIATTDHLESLILWLNMHKEAISATSEVDKIQIQSHLQNLARFSKDLSLFRNRTIAEQIKDLPLFTRVCSSPPHRYSNLRLKCSIIAR